MHRVSSQLTLFLRIAVPTIWLSAVLSLLVLLGLSVKGTAGLMANPLLWTGLLVILATGLVIMKLVFWRYYRVDMDDRHLYITNYFRTYRYPLSEIESISNSTILPGRSFSIRLRSKGYFGQRIRFLASQGLWADYLAHHPEWRDRWFGTGGSN